MLSHVPKALLWCSRSDAAGADCGFIDSKKDSETAAPVFRKDGMWH